MLYDITPPVTPRLKVWPGDTPMSREVLLDMQRGDNITLSTLHATVHLGAHADGANHYAKNAPGIEARPLHHYLGPCQVVSVPAERNRRVALQDIPVPIDQPRVLFHTKTYPDPDVFNEDFAALEPALIDALARRGVLTIGIDTPSVDLFTSQDLPAHQAFLRNDMAILEGLVLSNVPDGVYDLIALPLKLVGFDASPVRAVLRTID
ncbi:MAG: cyclase family protein [Planctomycetota bacterium]|nr:cyclase family protein [Planctomycetota bacterium]